MVATIHGRVQPVPRVRLASPTSNPDDELPFRILVVADAVGRRQSVPMGLRRPETVTDGGLSTAVAKLQPTAGGLRWSTVAGPTVVEVTAQLSELAALATRRRAALQAESTVDGRLRRDVEAALLAERLADGVATALDQPAVRRLGGLWTALEILVAHAGRGVEVALLAATRDELEEDLGDAPELTQSGLYQTIYAAEYGQHGGRPWGLLVSDLAIGNQSRDIGLLRRFAALAAMAHAPLILDAVPGLLGLADWTGLTGLVDVEAGLGTSTAFAALRRHDDARHIGLALPPVPVGAAARAGGERPMAPASLIVAARLAACHAASGWCVTAAGSGPTAEVAVPALAPWSSGEQQPATPCLLTELQAHDLAAQGLIALCADRRRSAVAMPALPSLYLGGDQVPAQLGLMLLVDRVAHHLKVLQREQLGTHISHQELERVLTDWLDRHVADGQVDDAMVRLSRPLRSARVRVQPVPGHAGWLRADLSLCPYLPGAAGDVELSLTSRLERPTS